MRKRVRKIPAAVWEGEGKVVICTEGGTLQRPLRNCGKGKGRRALHKRGQTPPSRVWRMSVGCGRRIVLELKAAFTAGRSGRCTCVCAFWRGEEESERTRTAPRQPARAALHRRRARAPPLLHTQARNTAAARLKDPPSSCWPLLTRRTPARSPRRHPPPNCPPPPAFQTRCPHTQTQGPPGSTESAGPPSPWAHSGNACVFS